MNPQNNENNGQNDVFGASTTLGQMNPGVEPLESLDSPTVGETLSPFGEIPNSVPTSNTPVEPLNNEFVAPTNQENVTLDSLGINPSQDTLGSMPVQPDSMNPVIEPAAPDFTNVGIADTLNNNINSEPNVGTLDQVTAEPANVGFDTNNTGLDNNVAPSTTTPQGPTMPIPDVMPTGSDYQATISTPVDYATPMSDFDQIGSTPEIDPKKRVKKGSPKLIKILCFLIIIGGIGFGCYYFINIKGIFDNSSVTTKNITLELGQELTENINDYATFKNTSSSNCTQDLSQVDVTKVGTYEYKITCGDKSYTGNVSVVDTTAPDAIPRNVIAKVNDQLEPSDFIKECSEDNCTYEFKDSSAVGTDLTTSGLKTIVINVSDENGNNKELYIPLFVAEFDFNYGLIAYKTETNSESGYTLTEKHFVEYVSQAGYTLYQYKFDDESSYDEIANAYTNNGTLTIGEVTGIPVFNKKNLQITIVKEYANIVPLSDYGSTNTAFTEAGYTTNYVRPELGTNGKLSISEIEF